MSTDQKDCIMLIYQLPKKHRDKGIKLFLFMANNIITNPNEKKCQIMYYDKIYRKFNQYDEFIQLLLHSGFKKLNKSKTILLFNIKHIDLLKGCIQYLTQQTVSNGINGYKKHHKKSLIHEYLCICNNILVKTTPKIYGKEHHVFCDECFIECKSDETIYHCSKHNKSTQHKYGYDLCEGCLFNKKQRNRYNLQRIRKDEEDELILNGLDQHSQPLRARLRNRGNMNDDDNKLDQEPVDESIAADLDHAVDIDDAIKRVERHKVNENVKGDHKLQQ